MLETTSPQAGEAGEVAARQENFATDEEGGGAGVLVLPQGGHDGAAHHRHVQQPEPRRDRPRRPGRGWGTTS